MKLDDYNYYLPKERIALKPSVPRDFSRLFVYDTEKNEIFYDKFLNLGRHLPQPSFLVLNDTRVLPARVKLQKDTGGRVSVLLFVDEIFSKKKSRRVRGLVDCSLKLGQKLFFNNDYYLVVVGSKESVFEFSFHFPSEILFKLLSQIGEPPIPLYLRKTPLRKDELSKRYQTIFGKKEGSIAAPTASLHFTKRVFEDLKKKKINRYFITLHVGWGTFAPLQLENIKSKRLHQEYVEVNLTDWKTIKRRKSEGDKLVAVGTTVVRAVESLALGKDQRIQFEEKKGKIFGQTELFIMPPYHFQMVDCLITNFHLPKSSLMMLVQAFLDFKRAKMKLVDLYKIAIRDNFRFYSFGDAMLVR